MTTKIKCPDCGKMIEIETEPSAEYEHSIDEKGNVSVAKKTVPVIEKRGTGKFEKRLKSGIAFDTETGKFNREYQLTEAEVDALGLKAPEMPAWMKTWLDKKATK